jgi:hypothetical protein
MSDAPERIWYNGTTLHARELRWRPPESDAHPQIEYIRKDIADAAVKAERERCAQVAEGRLGVLDALRKSSFWTKGMEELVACAEEEARIIAAAIRKGEQP